MFFSIAWLMLYLGHGEREQAEMSRRLLQPRRYRKAIVSLFSRRAVGSCVLLLFCFQFSRYYLLIELDQFLCLEANHLRAAGAVKNHDHHHEHDAEAVPHSHDDSGYAFQHCKDTFQGIALTPVQPLGLAALTSVSRPPDTVAMLRVAGPQFSEFVLLPSSPPPRS